MINSSFIQIFVNSLDMKGIEETLQALEKRFIEIKFSLSMVRKDAEKGTEKDEDNPSPPSQRKKS